MPIMNQIVSGGGPAGLYREFQLDANGKLIPNTTTTHIMDFTGVTDVGDYTLMAVYQNNTAISGALDMSDLTTISGIDACYSTFSGCTGLTSAVLSALTTLSGQNACAYMFSGCRSLISANLSALTTLSGGYACTYMFSGCIGLVSASLPALTTVISAYACRYMFQYCTGLTSADLSALTKLSGQGACQQMFAGCTSLATVYIGGTTAIDFGTRTDLFYGMFQGCAQNIDVYAPAANQSAIEAMSGYPNFGCTGTVTWHWRS